MQWLAFLGITGPMRLASAAAIEVVLRLPPLHLELETEARAGIYRFYCNEQWKPKSEEYEHAYMSWGMEEHLLQMVTDKMIPRHVYDKPFMVRLPDRSEWQWRWKRRWQWWWCWWQQHQEYQ